MRAGRRLVCAFLGRSEGQGYMFRNFLFSVILFSFLTVLIFRLSLFLQRLTTGGEGQDRTGPTRSAIETRDETGRATGTCRVIFCCLLYSFLFLALLLFQMSTVPQYVGLGGPNGT